MDLHAWIAQQVDRVEALATVQPPAPWRRDVDEDQVLAADDICVAETFALSNRQQHAIGVYIVAHAPDNVLRRCEADRRILARHKLDPDVTYEPACEGCGTYGDMGLSNIDNLNDCPELLDLAHAHGLTDEILAGLDQPQTPAPKPRHPSDAPPLLGSAAAAWTGALLDSVNPTRPVTTSDVPEALRGPRWKP